MHASGVLYLHLQDIEGTTVVHGMAPYCGACGMAMYLCGHDKLVAAALVLQPAAHYPLRIPVALNAHWHRIPFCSVYKVSTGTCT